MSEKAEKPNMAEAIRALQAEKRMSDDAIKQTIEDMVKAAYKKTFGHNENCIVKFSCPGTEPGPMAMKTSFCNPWTNSWQVALKQCQQ